MYNAGDVIDDTWVVEQALGAGGMASVYKCHNVHSTRMVAALKILTSALRGRDDMSQRFVREAELLFTLDHPHIVKVGNVRLDADPPYIQMEFVQGESLAGELMRGPVPMGRALHYMEQVLSAMRYAHRKGVYHRDLKPGNILVSKGARVKIVDFGLAYEESEVPITVGHMAFGTVSYAPPEWVKRGQTDPMAWDIYACGVILYEMLTGRLAFPLDPMAGPRQQAVQVMSLKNEMDGLHLPEDYPEALRTFVFTTTSKDPKVRPPNMREALKRLQRAMQGLGEDLVTMMGDHVSYESFEIPKGLLADDASESDAQPPLRSPQAPQAPQTWSGHSEQAVADATRLSAASSTTLRAPQIPPGGAAASGGYLAPGLQQRRSRSWIGTGVLTLLLVALVALAAAVGGGLALFLAFGPEPPRSAVVVITGVPPHAEVAVRVGALRPTRIAGAEHHFVGLSATDDEVRWAAGRGCESMSCPGEACPDWCETGTTKLSEGQMTTISVSLPKPLTVEVQTGAPANGRLGDSAGLYVPDRGLVFTNVEPGKHELVVYSRDCDDDGACAFTGDCAKGCTAIARTVLVSQESATFPLPLTSVAPRPRPVPGPRPTPGPKPSPAPTPVSAPSGSGQVVGAAAFKSFLNANPTWAREAAISAGKADDNYLMDFGGSGPAVSVSWYAAQAFCKSRGGLAELDAPPTNWTESASAPFQEWRSAGGKPAWRRYDGASSSAASATESNVFTGFRCKR